MFNLFNRRKQEPGALETSLKAYFENPGRKTAIGLLRGLKAEYDAAADAEHLKSASLPVQQSMAKPAVADVPSRALA